MAELSRARRAELARRAREIRLACQREGKTVEQTVDAIRADLREVLPLEAWRLAYGWSRPAVLEAFLALYRADGLEEPPVNTSMLCKWEHGTQGVSYAYGHMLARLYKVPPERLGLHYDVRVRTACTRPVGSENVVAFSRHADAGEEADPMRRRTLLAAAGLGIPLHLLERVDDALAVLPAPDRPEGLADIKARLQGARRQYDASALAELVAGLPGMLSAARDAAERYDTPAGWALLAACYDMATNTLNKVGQKTSARITADRSMLYAERSGDAVAMAASARALGMMLRTEGRHEVAAAVMSRGVDYLEATGLRMPAQASMYIRLLCARAYTYSWGGDRERALEGIADAEHAVTRLAALRPQTAVVAPFVTLYRVDIHYALGDAGTALHVGRDLRTEMYPTPERRGRLHTDMARAWWMWGKPEQTAHALLSAYEQAPSEVRDRPTIRKIADDLTALHPRASGVRELAAAIEQGRAP